MNKYYLNINFNPKYIYNWGLGIGDWGLGFYIINHNITQNIYFFI